MLLNSIERNHRGGELSSLVLPMLTVWISMFIRNSNSHRPCVKFAPFAIAMSSFTFPTYAIQISYCYSLHVQCRRSFYPILPACLSNCRRLCCSILTESFSDCRRSCFQASPLTFPNCAVHLSNFHPHTAAPPHPSPPDPQSPTPQLHHPPTHRAPHTPQPLPTPLFAEQRTLTEGCPNLV